MKKPTDFAVHMTKFLTAYLQTERNVSSNTIKTYRFAFTLFISYMHQVKNIKFEKLYLKHLTRNNVLDYLEWLETDRKCAPASRNFRLATFKSFAKYLQYEDVANALQWQQIMCISAKKSSRRPISHLSVEGMKQLLSQPDVTTASGLREVALLSLIYDCGARVSEIINLTPAAVKISTSPMTIALHGKGRKPRTVNILPEQVAILKHYMELNHLFDDSRSHHPLFFNHKHEKLSRSGVAYILKKNIERVKAANNGVIPEHFTLHGLRHTKAMHLLEAGWDIVQIRDFLGHSSIKTTDVYTRANNQMQEEALKRAYPNIAPETPTEKEWHGDDYLKQIIESIKIYVD